MAYYLLHLGGRQECSLELIGSTRPNSGTTVVGLVAHRLSFMNIDLKRLHDRLVTVEVALNGEESHVCRGRARFSCDPLVGPALGILVADPAGEFEFLIDAEKWVGEVAPDSTGESDFRIYLDSACAACV